MTDEGNETDGLAWAPHTTTTRPLPEYVCCVVTEGIWTWFGASLLIVVFFTAATLRYCKKYLQREKYTNKNMRLHVEEVLVDDKGAIDKVRHGSIPLHEFQAYYAKRRKHRIVDSLEFSKTVQAARKHPVSVALEPENEEKNQSPEVIPFDYNRVKLQRSSTDASDYINASFVDTCMSERAWIVTQGPMENTLEDFWQLVWQERSPVIVMLTRTFEYIKVMCMQYWPNAGGAEKPTYRCGSFSVTLLRENEYADYTIRQLLLECGGESRLVRQYHYRAWMAYSMPAPYSVIQFIRRLRRDIDELKEGMLDGPLVAHCYEGGWRSGVFIAIDDNLLMMAQRQQVDVFLSVKMLHEQRLGLVAAPEHIRFIYDVLEDEVLCGVTTVPIDGVLQRIQAKSKRDPATGLNDYQREYRLLESLIPRFSIGDCAAGHMAENRAKNRNVLVVPPDNARPYLTSLQGNEATNYVNAVFVDSYRRPDEFICTEWPLAHTLSDFWALVHDHKVKTIVVLSHPKIGRRFPSFWPTENDEEKYGPSFTLTVENKSLEENGKFAAWDLKLQKQEVASDKLSGAGGIKDLASLLQSLKRPATQLRLFQMLCWPSKQKVPSSTVALVKLIGAVNKWRAEIADAHETDRVLVLSEDGYTRVGMYCAATACVDQAHDRGHFDVFQAVKQVRKSRPQFVASVTELRYTYDLILHHLQTDKSVPRS